MSQPTPVFRSTGRISWGRVLGFGILVWLVPFVVALAVGPLKTSWRSLFESIMPVVVVATVVVCSLLARE